MKKFIITSIGCSGTLYTTKVLNYLGVNAVHEKLDLDADGIVSWKHGIGYAHLSKSHIFMHQLRDPLKTISSLQTIMSSSWKYIYDILEEMTGLSAPIHIFDKAGLVANCMVCWYTWHTMIEKSLPIAYTFRVEDMDCSITDILNLIGAEVDVDKFDTIDQIPCNTHTRAGKYTALTWDDLYKADKGLAEKIKEYAKTKGYEYD